MDTTFAIVGTAGRKEDGKRLTEHHFTAMMECARLLIKEFKESEYGVDTLVSGGAAWADHVAVRLFLQKEVPKLKLFLPCPWLTEARQYDPAPRTESERQNKYSIGEIANGYHSKFSQKCRFSSLNDIQMAMERGAELIVGNGFKHRNAKVAESDIILAMTFGDHEYVKDAGGTSHTVLCYLSRVRRLGFFDKSFHYDLISGEIFAGAKVRAEDNPE